MYRKKICSIKTVGFFIILFLIVILSGCSFFKSEESLANDKKDLNKVLNGFFVTYWKGAKISLRAIPVTNGDSGINFKDVKKDQAEKMNLGPQLSRIYDWELFLNDVKEEGVKLSAKEMMAFAKEIYTMSDTIKDMDEDEYPTVIEIISKSRALLKKDPLSIPANWNNSMEHWVFAAVMEAKPGFGSWKSYELDRVNPTDLVTTDLQTLAFIHKGIDSLRNDWKFIAEETFTQALSVLEKSDIMLQPDIEKFFSSVKRPNLSTDENFRLNMLAVTHLLRGFSRKQIGTSEYDELAVNDVEKAVKYFAKLGIENEFVWVAESYLFIKNNETDKAIESLTKLENSRFLTSREKKLIKEAKAKIKDRDTDSALNFITDKIIMYKLGMNYTSSCLSEIEWMRLLERTEEGRRILAKFTELQESFKKAKKYLDLGRLKEKSKNLTKKLTE